MIHLQGLGVVGGMIAWHLHERRVPFTWHDADALHVAWRASTGAIYPSGDDFDRQNYDRWTYWSRGHAPWLMHIGSGHLEVGAWWYSTKAPPHGAKYAVAEEYGGLRRLTVPSFHFNAQSFVMASQNFFRESRRPSAPAGSRLLVTHGTGPRLDHYVWGWTRRVRLAWNGRSTKSVFGRPAFYFRRGRFVMAYAYPVPGEPYWYAGSHLIVQKRARSLEMPPKYEQWKRNFTELSGGHVRVVEEGEYTEGWRPAGASGDTDLVRDVAGTLCVKPFWNSGIRHAPLTVNAALAALGVW